jgi:predicted dienelactone hydrolase
MNMLARLLTASLALLFAAALHAEGYDPLAVPKEAVAVTKDVTVQDATRQREIPLRIYFPADPKPAPVVLFSHGLGGSREGYSYLGRQWAGRGYVAVFLQHHGSDDGVWKGKPAAEVVPAMRAALSVQNFFLRAADVKVTLDQLEKWNAESGHFLAGRLDLAHIAMSGHSFGAVTTQAVSGQTFSTGASVADPRIKAAIILSPSKPSRGDTAEAFGSVHLPWLLMTGTNDIAKIGGATLGATDISARLVVYPALPPGDKYELVLNGADHMVFSDRDDSHETQKRNPNHHRVILALSTAFLDAYLRDDAAAREWLQGDAPRKLMEEKDRWQRK